MKPHNPTRTPAATACQPDVVRGARLRIPETENERPFDEDASTSHFAVDTPQVKSRGYTEEMLKIMLSDCRRSVEKRKAELAEIEPTRAMLTEELRRLRLLEEDILGLINVASPDLRSELDASSSKRAAHRVSSTSVWALLAARADARRNGNLD